MNKYYLSFILIFCVIFEGFSHEILENATRTTVIRNGIGLGSVIAGVTSWDRNKSVLLATIHGFFSWLYVIYFVLTRKRGPK